MKDGITIFAAISCSILKCKDGVITGNATLTNLTTLEKFRGKHFKLIWYLWKKDDKKHIGKQPLIMFL
jgi:hypothetical protein